MPSTTIADVLVFICRISVPYEMCDGSTAVDVRLRQANPISCVEKRKVEVRNKGGFVDRSVYAKVVCPFAGRET